MRSIQLQKKASNAIQIKDHAIRYVAAKNPSISAVKSFGEKFLPKGIIEKGKIVDEKAFDDILEECVKEWKLKNKEVKFFTPDSSVFFRKLTIPLDIPDDEVRGYLNFEIGTSIHLPFEDAYFDFHFLPQTSEENREILFFATPEALMKQYRKKLEEFKLKPIVADVSSLCIYNLFSILGMADEKEHYLVVEWDLTSINLSIFHQHIPVFMRNITQNFEEDDWEMGRWGEVVDLHCKDKEKIEMQIKDNLSEMERVMNFYKYSLHQGEKEITTILVVGDHPMLASIKKSISEYDVPMISLNERELGFHYEKLGIHSNYMLPLSLCLKEV
ncbi:type IV pilus biogenesis protein PilM [Evansella tamaricis]|uniref:Pilus assembly protein PilM n=1 Tax=Evansella tamaricis TaxID=2069301 RepID=A0ABS6JBG2_9BACI|nr:pilus assembly protein PilM [Evansella tamaricis]MBU9711017.1 pilus assembly protein PilM [Evansella tamaricis]